MNNLFVIEGPDAVGKATQTKLLATALDGKVLSFPRYDTPQGAVIKKLLQGPKASGYSVEEHAIALQAVMTWDRYDAYGLLENAVTGGGSTIVCDRYWMSGYVYGRLDGLGAGILRQAHRGLPQPRTAILLDVPFEEQLRRLKERGRATDQYEIESFMIKTHAEYEDAWRTLPNFFPEIRWVQVNGLGNTEEVHERIMEVLA